VVHAFLSHSHCSHNKPRTTIHKSFFIKFYNSIPNGFLAISVLSRLLFSRLSLFYFFLASSFVCFSLTFGFVVFSFLMTIFSFFLSFVRYYKFFIFFKFFLFPM